MNTARKTRLHTKVTARIKDAKTENGPGVLGAGGGGGGGRNIKGHERKQETLTLRGKRET